MRRIIITTLIALAALGGVASADRGHRRNDNRGVRVERVHPQQTYRLRQGRTYVQPRYRTMYRPQVRIVRRPIFVQRPVIRYHYYNYYRRPTLIVENYPAKAGYLWVSGQWTWSGYEWIWQAGHYEPDPAYNSYYDEYGAPNDQPYEYDSYDNGTNPPPY